MGKQRKEQQARRGSSIIKQEVEGQNGYFLHQDQFPVPYLPVSVPAPGMIQGPYLKDQEDESIRKLLVKLEGNFSYDHHHQLFDNSTIAVANSSTSLNSLESNFSQLPSSHFNMPMFQGLNSNYSNGQEEVVIYSNPEGADDTIMRANYGMVMVNGNSSWDDMSSLVYPHEAGNERLILQDSAFEESTYFGLQ